METVERPKRRAVFARTATAHGMLVGDVVVRSGGWSCRVCRFAGPGKQTSLLAYRDKSMPRRRVIQILQGPMTVAASMLSRGAED